MNNTNHKTMLSEHFALEEFAYSRIAVENGLDNVPPEEAKKSILHLVTYLLEPLRKVCKAPIAILSGYRSEEVNRRAGGVANSQHRKGEAADCYVAEGPEKLLVLLKASGLVFDQAILYKHRHFLHLSLTEFGKNRMQVIVYMVCVICLFSGCGMGRNIRQSESSNRYDSVRFDNIDSLLLQHRSILCDSQLWELKQTVYLPPDSSGRQALQSVTVARFRQVITQTDSLSTTTTAQQSYSALTTENTQKQETRRSTNTHLLILIIAGVCLLIGGVVYRCFLRSSSVVSPNP